VKASRIDGRERADLLAALMSDAAIKKGKKKAPDTTVSALRSRPSAFP
jgi:hypothetical protein